MSLKITLITSLLTVSIAGISTGGYFLLRGSTETSKDSKSKSNEQKNVGEGASADGDRAGVGGVPGADDSGSKPAESSASSDGKSLSASPSGLSSGNGDEQAATAA